MKKIGCVVLLPVLAAVVVLQARQPSGAVVSGEPGQWHKVTLTLDGPDTSESASTPNPFVDYRLTITFAHESGTPAYHVPGVLRRRWQCGELRGGIGQQVACAFRSRQNGALGMVGFVRDW